MGRMVSLFDLNLGVSTNKMLTERPHRDGLDLSQNWLELSSNTLQPSEHIEDKPISHESRCPLNNVASGTPMKMLLAQEMSKEGDSKQKPPNVVARLMGLDAIPALEPLYQSERSQFSPVFERNKYEGYSRSSKEKYHEEHHYIPIQVDTTPPETSIRRQQHRNGLKEKHSLPAIRSHCFVYEEEECRDVHEVRLSSTKERSNNQSLQKVSYNDNLDERKMDLVRQKFMEAKRLATDEKLRQSKEFQEALEVLSSNRELFLKFLQEPASLFAMGLDNLQSIQSIPPQTQSKRITVLKPSKAAIENGSWKQLNSSKRVVTAELKNDRLHRNGETENRSTKKHLIESKGPNENVSPWTSTFDQQSICYVRPQGEPDNLSHLTRIVVLKPSQRTVQDIRTVVASPPPKPHSRASHRSTLDRFMDASADENKDLPVREITTQMHESTSSHSLHSSSAREEPLFSSVLSNGYVGDESSHSRSENEYVGGNLSDSEVMTPTSRYSWDFVNRCNSYSSFLSRASYSPESSVNKEAKRRLSDRWVLMAHGNKERQLRRSSSTLGEMLSIPELKESTNLVGDTIEEVVGTSRSRSHAEHGNERSCVSSSKFTDFSPKRNVSRSRSVPASLRTFETLRKEDEARKSEQPRPIAKVEKPKNAKSFKGKLSSLFFSKNQKTSKEKCDPVPLLGKAQAGKSLTTDVSRSVPQRQLATTSNCGSSSSPLSNSHEQCITGSSSSPIIEPKDDRVMERPLLCIINL